MKMPFPLEKMMFGFIESQVLFVCNEIKLFDFLSEHGPAECIVISNKLDIPVASLERLLICATSMNLLEKTNNEYQLKEEWLPFLVRKSEHYCGGKFAHYWKLSYKLFEYLNSALKEDKPQWDKIENLSSGNELNSVYANAIYSDTTATQEFLETMWASGYKDSLELCKQYPFKRCHTLIDLGGATGSFAIAAMQENKHLQAIIMDYSQVKPYAEEKFYLYQMSQRAKFLIGDMFKDKLPIGDIYSIGYVLSDWPEDLCLSLLRKVYESLPENGLVVILEKFFNEDKTGPYLTAMLNITMLLEMHGKHRTAKEYITWLQQIGFRDFQVVYSSGEKHMIVGKK